MSMTVIEHIELTSSETSITFSAISGDYTDLLVLGSARSDRSAVDDNCLISFNGNTSNFSLRRLFGTGTGGVGSITTPARFAGYLNGNSSTSNTFSSFSIYIPNYTAAAAKSYSSDSVAENNAGEGYDDISAGLWNDTSTITSVSLEPGTGTNFLSGSSFTLFGITAGSDGTTTVS